MTGLFDVLDEQARDRPHATALVVTGDRIPVSYGVLAWLVDDVAAGLDGMGLRRGDAVGLVGANTIEFVVALLGAARTGLVVAPLDPALALSEMTDRLDRLGTRAVLVGPTATGFAPVTEFGIPTLPVRVDISAAGGIAWVDTGGGPVQHDDDRETPDFSADDALVLFTSGTTGRAKMVPLTHANVATSVQAICATYELGPGDATAAVMPFFHGHGLIAVLLASLASGGRVLLPARGRFSASTFWDDAQAAGATWFSAVPTIHQILLQRSAAEYPGPNVVPLRFVRSSSAPLDTTTVEEMERTFGAPVLAAYGMTETTHQAASERVPGHSVDKLGSVGPASGAVRLRIVDADGHSCPAGAVGEVWVSGPTVVRGYLAEPAGTAASFTDGWFRTGDLGSLDPDGCLFLTGRIKNIINRGGEKISPEHVEGVLTGCDGVIEAAVFAIPDETYGELVGAAVVVARERATGPDQIVQECRAKLSPFEVPARLEVVAALPHTAKGALDRRAVEDQYAR